MTKNKTANQKQRRASPNELAPLSQKGFSYLELAIVAAITGLLSMLAISQYEKSLARTQVAEAFSLLAPVKTALNLYHNENNAWPDGANNAARHQQLGIVAPNQLGGDYVRRIQVRADGRTRIQFATQANGAHRFIADKRFWFEPEISPSGSIIWKCATRSRSNWIDANYLSGCS